MLTEDPTDPGTFLPSTDLIEDLPDLGTFTVAQAIDTPGYTRWVGAPSWRDVLIQPFYVVKGVGEFPLGLFYCRTPEVDYDDTVPRSADVTLYDATLRVGADFTSAPGPVSIPAGAGIAATIAARLTAVGVTRYAITTTAKTLPAPLVFETGDSEGKILNGLLSAAGYWSIHADPYGVMLAEPYLPPEQRVPTWEFPETGDASVSGAEWSREFDDFQVWNRLSGVSRTKDPDPPLTYTANLDDLAPWSPHTASKRGMVISGPTLRDVDAADLDALKTQVNRALLDQASVADKITFTHPWLDTVQLGDVVTWWHDGEARRYAIEQQSVTLELGVPVKSTGRRVA